MNINAVEILAVTIISTIVGCIVASSMQIDRTTKKIHQEAIDNGVALYVANPTNGVVTFTWIKPKERIYEEIIEEQR